MKLEDITLEKAIGLLSLPRLLGNHPDTGGKIKAGLGRFGPYIVHDQGKEGKDYRSLKAEDDILTVNLERSLELLAQPKRTKRGNRGDKKPLRELGIHPEDKEAINLYEGPYGLYIKHGKVNVGLPEGEKVDTLTLETALELLATKATTKKKITRNKTTSKNAKSTVDNNK